MSKAKPVIRIDAGDSCDWSMVRDRLELDCKVAITIDFSGCEIAGFPVKVCDISRDVKGGKVLLHAIVERKKK